LYTPQFASLVYLVRETESSCAEVNNASVSARIWWSLSGSFAVSLRFLVVLSAVCLENRIATKREARLPEFFDVFRQSSFWLAPLTSCLLVLGQELAFWHTADPREVAFVNH
jgi:hypothetical protein